MSMSIEKDDIRLPQLSRTKPNKKPPMISPKPKYIMADMDNISY